MKTILSILLLTLTAWAFTLFGYETETKKAETLSTEMALLDSAKKTTKALEEHLYRVARDIPRDGVTAIDTVYIPKVEVTAAKPVIIEKPVYEKVYINRTITKTNNIFDTNPRGIDIKPYTTIDTVYK